VRVHDPVALGRLLQEHPDLGVQTCHGLETLAQGADALVLLTEWPQYRGWPYEELAKRMRRALLVDGRNFLDHSRLVRAGFEVVGMGVPSSVTEVVEA
jgi:UDPglucose 6-dehydrogenase